ncbi:MAG: CocE/NonD family hydrolase [Myxococcales bacterium]|nr:CocE/NonD family hydrolase [Myxococcales bacterium]
MKTSGKAFALFLSLALAACGSSQTPRDAGPDGDGEAADGGDLFGTDQGDGGEDGGDEAIDCAAYLFEDVSIPTRDGKALAAFVRRPANSACRLPAILIQTPYNKENARSMWFAHPENEPLFGSRDYAFVVVDWRGFFGSKDAAVSGTQPYAQDGYDVVEWIASQAWSDGKVGTWGVSALCQQQWRTAVQRPPHLSALVPIFCQANQTYTQYYPGGVLRKEYFDFISAYFGIDILKDHPLRDNLWRLAETLIDLGKVSAPALVVAGWYDLYNAGTLRDFEAVRTTSNAAIREKHRLLVGPWIHFAVGGESSGAGRELDAQEKLFVDADKTIQRDSLLFFDFHLRGIQNQAAAWPEARWTLGGAGGEESGTWPPAGLERVYYLVSGGSLSESAPQAASVSFPFDPDDPSPTVGGQTLLPTLRHGPRLQDEVLARADALSFVGPELSAPLTVRGRMTVELAVSTTGADTDFAVRLTDVGPDGKHLLIADGIRRLKLREDFSQTSPVVSGERYALTVDMVNDLGYRFAAGHRVGLIVTGSNYPRFERNPNNGEHFYADAASSVAVTETLYLDGTSRLVLSLGE